MKLFLFMLLVGYASASLLKTFEKESRSTVAVFINGLQSATPLHMALGMEDSEEILRLERDIKEELVKHIKEAFERALKKIEDAVANGKKVNERALKMLKDLREKMIELNITDEEITAELEVLKGKVDDQLKQILKKMGIIDRRSTELEVPEIFDSVLGDLSIREMFLKLKKMILEKLDIGTVKNSLAKIVGQGSKNLCEWVTNKGKEKVMNFFDRILESGEEPSKRATEDHFQEIKDYLENLEEDIEKKLLKFKNWLHDLIGNGLDKAKEKMQKIAGIFRKIIEENKDVSQKRLAELLEHLRQYENEFGSLYDLQNVIKKILNKSN